MPPKYSLPCSVFLLISNGIYRNEYISLLCLLCKRDKVLKDIIMIIIIDKTIDTFMEGTINILCHDSKCY